MPSTSSPRSGPSVSLQEQIYREWEAAAPEWGRRELWSYVEHAAQALNERLVELADLRAGDYVLDLGTGVGEPAATAARRIAPDGRVLGVDLSPGMLEEARKRLVRLGLQDVVDLRQDDAELLALEHEENAFDAVVSRWALMLAADFRGLLGGLRRITVPGGRLAVALWGHPERVPFIQLAMGTAIELMQPETPPAPPDDGPEHLWSRGQKALDRFARDAGWTDVRTEAFDVAFEFPSPEVYADFICRMAGPIKVQLDHQPPEARQRLVGAIAQRAEPFRDDDGSVRLVNENLILFGRRPSA